MSNSHVSGRETLYIFPWVDDADTIFLDVTGPAWPQHPSDLKRTVEDLLADDFGVVAADDGYLLLQRGAVQKTVPADFFTAWQTPADSTVLESTSRRSSRRQILFLAMRSSCAVTRSGSIGMASWWST